MDLTVHHKGWAECFPGLRRSEMAVKLRELRRAGAYIWRTDEGYSADWIRAR